ncbi:MAG: FtsQ-type POTRA domain-containing protein [Desulfobacula sp.]|nr:FtsQ-type POTRA domain-containing protein [Desulfobacula sp.]
MNKKIKANRYKPEPRKTRNFSGGFTGNVSAMDFCLKCIITIAFFSVLSLASIFMYDFTTQSKFFNIKNIEITGTQHAFKKDILELADLNCDKNIFKANLFTIEKQIATHPWVASAVVNRNMACELIISIIEEKPLAIVKIENLADILINAQGRPFKEYNPQKDNIKNLPVITGIDLKSTRKKPEPEYMFKGPLFDSIMEFLKLEDLNDIKTIKADENIGISIEANDIYNTIPLNNEKTIQIQLGFDKFKAKLSQAVKISAYIDKNFPERTICALDLSNLEKVFIKTAPDKALQIDDLIKGV